MSGNEPFAGENIDFEDKGSSEAERGRKGIEPRGERQSEKDDSNHFRTRMRHRVGNPDVSEFPSRDD